MSNRKIFLKSLDNWERTLEIPFGQTIIGRGPFLGCFDRRVSRNHGILQVTENGNVYICSKQEQPIYYRPNSTIDNLSVMLKKDVAQKLSHGDSFTLLPRAYAFQILIVNLEEAKVTNENSSGNKEEAKMAYERYFEELTKALKMARPVPDDSMNIVRGKSVQQIEEVFPSKKRQLSNSFENIANTPYQSNPEDFSKLKKIKHVSSPKKNASPDNNFFNVFAREIDFPFGKKKAEFNMEEFWSSLNGREASGPSSSMSLSAKAEALNDPHIRIYHTEEDMECETEKSVREDPRFEKESYETCMPVNYSGIFKASELYNNDRSKQAEFDSNEFWRTYGAAEPLPTQEFCVNNLKESWSMKQAGDETSFKDSKVEGGKARDSTGPEDDTDCTDYESEPCNHIGKFDVNIDELWQILNSSKGVTKNEGELNNSTTSEMSSSEKNINVLEKVILKAKSPEPISELPDGWIAATHSSGKPVYLHRDSRVCTLSKPYCLGSKSLKKHDIPLSAIPHLQHEKELEKENMEKATFDETRNISLPVKVEQVEDSINQESLNVRESCKKKFQFETGSYRKFKTWADRRKYKVEKIQKSCSPLTKPKLTGLTQPIKSAICHLNEYAQYAFKAQPKYKFELLKSDDGRTSSFSAIVRIKDKRYGDGWGIKKKQAKLEAAKAALEVIHPKFLDTKRKEEEELIRNGEEILDDLAVEDPRVADLASRFGISTPFDIILKYTNKNHMAKNVKFYPHPNLMHSKFQMNIGNHTVLVTCNSKREGQQYASQAILKVIHSEIKSYGDLLKLYGCYKKNKVKVSYKPTAKKIQKTPQEISKVSCEAKLKDKQKTPQDIPKSSDLEFKRQLEQEICNYKVLLEVRDKRIAALEAQLSELLTLMKASDRIKLQQKHLFMENFQSCPQASLDLFNTKVDISNMCYSARKELCCQKVHKEIRRSSGATVTIRGDFKSTKEQTDSSSFNCFPLYLHVQAHSQESVLAALRQIGNIIEQHDVTSESEDEYEHLDLSSESCDEEVGILSSTKSNDIPSKDLTEAVPSSKDTPALCKLTPEGPELLPEGPELPPEGPELPPEMKQNEDSQETSSLWKSTFRPVSF